MKTALATFSLVSMQALASTAPQAVGVSQCSVSERTVFSCKLENGKVVSFCASPQVSAGDGYVQYRYGLLNRKPELVFPPSKSHPNVSFKTGFLMLAYNSIGTLAFSNGGYEYVLSTEAGKGASVPSIAISRSGKLAAQHKCIDDIVDNFTLDYHNELLNAGVTLLE